MTNLFRCAAGSDINCEKKFFEVNVARIVRVKSSKDVLAESFGTPGREEVLVDFDELVFCQMTLRTILLQINEQINTRLVKGLNLK